MRKNITRVRMMLVICVTSLIAACAQPAAETGKVYDPGQVSATCTENLGLDGAVIMSLAAAFRDTNGKITDSFKEKASKDIAESENVQPSESDAVFQQYISCLESSVAQ